MIQIKYIYIYSERFNIYMSCTLHLKDANITVTQYTQFYIYIYIYIYFAFIAEYRHVYLGKVVQLIT